MLLALLTVLLTGCAGSGASGSYDARVLTEDDLEEANLRGSTYQAVQRLRPMWLQTRGRASLDPGTNDPIWVYVEGTRIGSVEALRDFDAVNVGRIERLSARQANTRYGAGHTQGAILITLRRGN